MNRLNSIRNYLPLAALVAAAFALLALATGLGGIVLQPGRPFQLGAFVPGGGGGGGGFDIRLMVVAFIWLCILVSAVGLIVSRSLRRSMLRTLPLYIVYALLVYLFFSWLWSQSGAGGGVASNPPLPLDALPTPPPLDALPAAAPPTFVASPPQWLVLAVSLLVGLLVVFAIWLVARAARRAEPESALSQLAREAQSALSSLESGAGLRNAVLRCYSEMARVLAGQRAVQQDKTMTPREFEARLAGVGLRDDHIRRLTRLFEAVRYGGREPGEREEREAVACLQAIVAAYGKPETEREGAKARRREGQSHAP